MIIKTIVSSSVERWNLVLGLIFVAIISFMPEGLVPGSVRLWHAGLKLMRTRRAATADLAGPRP